MKPNTKQHPSSIVALSYTELSDGQGIAILQAELTSTENQGWCQLLPAGYFKAVDGRPHDVPGQYWFINQEIANRLITRLAGRKNDRVIDYEHQTLKTEENGKPAPAAGWFNSSETEWRDEKGLFIRPRWTDKAREYIESGEYKYLSAVFSYNKKTGEPTELKMAALVNYPGVDGLDEAVSLAASHYSNIPLSPDDQVSLYRRLIRLLGIPIADTELPTEAIHREALGRAAQLKQTSTPNHTAYVTRASYQAALKELNSLKQAQRKTFVEGVVQACLRDQKIAPIEVDYMTQLGMQIGAASLKASINARPSHIEIARENIRRHLTAEDKSVIKTCGIDPEQYIQSREQK